VSRRVGVLAAGVVLLLPMALVAPIADSARADSGGATFGSFTLTARADAANFGVIDPSAPILPAGQLVTASPATAQASFDSLGQSSGFASLPYPGEFVATLPGTLNGLLAGSFPPLPSYPFYVSSSYPTAPNSSNSQGPYGISATSSPTSSMADAIVGVATGAPQVASVHARSESTQNADGSLVADAMTDMEGFTFGQLLRIGSVTSHARLTVTAGQASRMTDSLQLGTMTVAGTLIGLTDKGIQVGSTTAPSPSASAVSSLLKSAGIELTYLPASRTPTSVHSAAIQISYTTKLPSQGSVVSTITLGQSSATIEATVTPAVSITAGSLATTASRPPDVGSLGSTGTSELPSTPAPSASAPAAAPVAAPALPGLVTPVGRVVTPKDPSGKSFYLALVLAGVAMVGISQLMRLLGVRLRSGRPPG
jgi:hypothetical protein